jgi:transposase, IS30 family
MCQNNYTKKNRKFKQISLRERIIISQMLKDNKSIKKIAEERGRDETTIRREIKRGTITLRNHDWTERTEYDPDYANNKALENKGYTGPHYKIVDDYELMDYLEKKIKNENYSPEAALLEIKIKGLNFETIICVKTLYNYIDKNIIEVGNQDLPVKRNKKDLKKRKKGKIVSINKGKSIEERPKEVNEKKEFGHWEMDTVIGKKEGNNAVLLVLTERTTNIEIIEKIKGKSIDSVLTGLKRIKRRVKYKIKTITCDNGTEFANHVGMKETFKNKIEIYYAHPYSSHERGSNENGNRLIRRFIPKGLDITTISKKVIMRIEEWINNYPRKKHDGLTANMMYNKLNNQVSCA